METTQIIEIILSYAGTFCLAFIFGWQAREIIARKKVESFLEEMAEETSRIIEIHIEHDEKHNIFVVYDKKDNRFLTQAKTYEEMVDFFNDRYPNTTVVLDKKMAERMQGVSVIV
jgi:RNA-splicing ligase RtcB